jgi:IS5 family transposase
MLRIYFLQQWYGLSDEALEDALYDSIAMRAFAGIDLAVENDAGCNHAVEVPSSAGRAWPEAKVVRRDRHLAL